MQIEFYRHNIGEKEKKNVIECLENIFLTAGQYVSDFEKNFAAYCDLNYCVGLNSCTGALHLSFLSLGIGPGDEVITTPMTFIATATSIMHTGATPVFVDVESESGLIDPEKIESAITERTKAIVPVHLYGQMCDMRAIKDIADRHGLKIVEDSAHCIEGEREGIRPGQLSDIACYSFYATKNITSGEGGAAATNDRDLADKIRLLRQHGMSKEAADRNSGAYKHWDMIDCGWKYNMDNIQAALLIPQLKTIDEKWDKRSKLYEKYAGEIKDESRIALPRIAASSKSAFHLFTIWVDQGKRDRIMHLMNQRGIGVAVNYRAIHLLSYFREKFGFQNGDFPAAEKIGSKTVSLPFYPKLTDSEQSYVIDSICEIVNSDI